MSTYLTPAIPLSLHTLPRDTVLVNLYTWDKGKVAAVVRGGKKPTGKLVNYFNLIAELEVMIAPGRNFDIVAGVDRGEYYEHLQTDLEKRIITLSFFDVLNRVSAEHEPDGRLYEYLKTWLGYLNQTAIRPRPLFLALSIWRLLALIGFKPNVETCLNCQVEFGRELFFSPAAQGIVCERCKNGQATQLPRELAALLKLIVSDQGDIEVLTHVARADFNEKTSVEILQHAEHLLEFEVRGLKVYNQVVKS